MPKTGNMAITRQQASEFEKTNAQLIGLFEEITALSRKNPDSPVNRFKLNLINHCLTASNNILGDHYRPFADFDHFEEDELPTNRDVVLVLSQYLSCLEKLRADNIRQKPYTDEWHWDIQEEGEDLKTAPPKKLKHN
jgi:hypothetical protein